MLKHSKHYQSIRRDNKEDDNSKGENNSGQGGESSIGSLRPVRWSRLSRAFGHSIESPNNQRSRYEMFNRLFSWRNSSSYSSPISRLASSLISPIRSRDRRSFFQTHLPLRSYGTRCTSHHRYTIANLFGFTSRAESTTTLLSSRSHSVSREYIIQESQDTQQCHERRHRKSSRLLEQYPRPYKRKHLTNRRDSGFRITSTGDGVMAKNGPSERSQSFSANNLRTPTTLGTRRAKSFGSATCHHLELVSFPPKPARSEEAVAAVKRRRQRGQRPTSLGRIGYNHDDSTDDSPEGRVCFPRAEGRSKESRLNIMKTGLKNITTAVSKAIRNKCKKVESNLEVQEYSDASKVQAKCPGVSGQKNCEGFPTSIASSNTPSKTSIVNNKPFLDSGGKSLSRKSSLSPETVAAATKIQDVSIQHVTGSLLYLETTFEYNAEGEHLSVPRGVGSTCISSQRRCASYDLNIELEKNYNEQSTHTEEKEIEDGPTTSKKALAILANKLKDKNDEDNKEEVDNDKDKPKKDLPQSSCCDIKTQGHVSRRDLHEYYKQGSKAMDTNRTTYTNSRPDLHLKCNRGSHSSDTSSAYSGSDTMTSLHSSALDGDEVDLSGLVESIVDSDEDDLVESIESLNVRDAVRECLEKDPSERTEEDIEILLEFTQGLKAFTNITLAVRRALCSVMVFAVVDKAGTVVMSDGEELDSWSVLINGHVEIDHGNGEKEELQMGDSFGILPTMDKLYHRGVMRTKCNDCQFVCITQTDYYRIQHQGEENTKRHEEDGKVVMVTELRRIGPDTNIGSAMKRGHVVIRGTVERLLLQLVEENSMTDPTYVEDFLLTHRTFIKNSQEVANKLLSWFENEEAGTSASPQEIRDRVTRVVLLWVNNHFTDFETDTEMMEFLETFESGLERKSLLSQLRLLHIACAAKARTRTITLARSSRDEILNFTIVGGYERGCYGVFISKVERNTKPDDVGLKRGDQILEVNGQSFEHVTNARAMEIIMGSTHLSITVKSNLLAFKEVIQSPDVNSSRPRINPRRICANDIAKLHGNADARPAMMRLSSADILTHDQVDCCQPLYRERESSGSGSLAGGIATASNFVAGLLGSSGSSKKDSSSLSVASSNNSTSSSSSSMAGNSSHQKGGFMTLGPKRRLQKALIKMNLLPKNSANLTSVDPGDNSSNAVDSTNVVQNMDDGRASTNISTTNTNSPLANSSNTSGNYKTGGNLAGMYHSRSNPDLTSNIYYEDTRQMEYPEHVLKVYKSDQTCKYLLINKETTAHEVVMLALQEFGIHETSSNFSLCEVSVGEGGMIKQRRLPDQLQNLAERIGLASRYYLKTNGITETLVPDDLALDLVRESSVHLLQLNANELAIQLTFQDFAIFRQIESTEYVDELFELKSKYGMPMLSQFSELVNREMFWVVTEVCSEHNIVRRMKIVKQFIKIARHCKECRNFNSMFAIISGLGHVAVSRLRQTWEKLPTKYQKLFTDLQDLMDPSRNMSKYRQLVSAEFLAQHPIIPFYPVVKKDLTFIHLGNNTLVEDLINFEKLRMIAKEVRILTHMCSSTYDLLTMLEFKGQPPSSAMVALNQMSVSSGPHHIHGSSGQATVKRRKKSTAAPNPKKMFEEAQMVRRVKAYLNNMKVVTDEDVLHSLSLECEPSAMSSTAGAGATGSGHIGERSGSVLSGASSGNGGSGSAPGSATIRKRHPSPTLSTTSSTSSTSEGRKGSGLGPKFGTASPQAVKKILSLSEQTKTRPYQPRHPGIILPLVGHPHSLHYPLHSSVSPSPSPGAHRRMGSGTSVPITGNRSVHERSHSDTPTPLPSVDLSVESSSVTSFGNMPLRKTITSGSVTSSDSGHGSYVQPEVHINYTDNPGGGMYHLNVQLPSNTPTSPKLQQRRHSAIHASGYYYNTTTYPSSPTMVTSVNPMDHHASMVGRKVSPTPQQSLIHQKPTLDERMLGLSLQQQYHPAPPPSVHSTQAMNSCSARAGGINVTTSGNGGGGSGGGGSVGAAGSTSGICMDVNLGYAPVTVRNLQYHPLPPPPPITPHPMQQQQQHQALQHTSQYHAPRNTGHGILMNPLVVPSTKGPRYPPSYTVAAHMARLHRLGRAHSLERVTNSMQGGGGGGAESNSGNSGSGTAGSYYQHELGYEDEENETQVSAV